MFLSEGWCAEHMTQLPTRSQVKGFTLEYLVRSTSPEPFKRFSLNFAQMFLSARRCAETMTQLRRLKVKVPHQGHVIYPSICVRSISPEPFERFSLNFTQMFLSDDVHNQRLSYTDSMSHFKVMGFTLEFRVRSRFPQPFVRFS